jgi:uncharacterized membrane protein YbaN (DUF454 family)
VAKPNQILFLQKWVKPRHCESNGGAYLPYYNAVPRFVYLMAGHASVSLGVIGIFLPLLPTTPFLLLAAACYLRSSDTHYQKLVGNPLLGPIILDYQQKQAIALRTKIVALCLLWASLGFSLYRTEKPFVEWVILGCGVIVTMILLRIRTLREE